MKINMFFFNARYFIHGVSLSVCKGFRHVRIIQFISNLGCLVSTEIVATKFTRK